jgi:endonuclease YncB( thermonuclease family)
VGTVGLRIWAALGGLGLLTLAAACGFPPALLPGGERPAPLPTLPPPRRTPLPGITATPVAIALPPSPTPTPPVFIGHQRARVLRVWDGQSFLIEGGLTVRLLGLEAPGAGVLGRPLAPGGREAALRAQELLEGKEVDLEQDSTYVDGNGQLPRYVYVDGVMVNRELLAAGLARLAVQPPDTRYQELLREAEREAREARRGLWAGPLPTPTRPRAPAPAPARPAAPTVPPTAIPRFDSQQAPVTRPSAPPGLSAPTPAPAPTAPVPTRAPGAGVAIPSFGTVQPAR